MWCEVSRISEWTMMLYTKKLLTISQNKKERLKNVIIKICLSTHSSWQIYCITTAFLLFSIFWKWGDGQWSTSIINMYWLFCDPSRSNALSTWQILRPHVYSLSLETGRTPPPIKWDMVVPSTCILAFV